MDASRGEGKGEGRSPSFTWAVKRDKDFCVALASVVGVVGGDTFDAIDAFERLDTRSRSSGGIGVGSRDQAYMVGVESGLSARELDLCYWRRRNRTGMYEKRRGGVRESTGSYRMMKKRM